MTRGAEQSANDASGSSASEGLGFHGEPADGAIAEGARVLVTGGAGYIGSVVGRRLLESGYQVTVLDDLSTGHRAGVPEGAQFVEGRVHDTAAKVLDRSYAAVLHFAAFSQVGESVAIPEKYWENNVVGTHLLLAAMRESGVRRLVFSSTAAVYGEPEAVPIPETARTAPTNPYGATKLAVDHMISAESAAHGLAAVSLRYFNVAGSYNGYGERHNPESHLIPLVLKTAVGELPRITVYGTDYPTGDGTCVRDYIHVADLAEAHLLALRRAREGEHLICNLGNGKGFTVREVIEAARRITGRPIPQAEAGRRQGDPAALVAGAQRAAAELGWQPARPGLDAMIADAWEFAQAGHARESR
jgi:UDP-glucose 4-epimerase